MKTRKIESALESKRITDITEKLKNLFELTDHEAEVYLVILNNASLTATAVSKVTSIRRSRTYEILRNLKEKGLVVEENGNPKTFKAKSPRLVVDSLIAERQRIVQDESAAMLGVQQVLQDIWTNQHEEQLGGQLFLLSEQLIREIVPQEIHEVKECLCLAIKEPHISIPETQSCAAQFFDHKPLSDALNEFPQRGIKFRILIGDLLSFLKRSWPEGTSILKTGIKEGFIEVKEIDMRIPHSFLIVDDQRVYMFFLDSTGNCYHEAIRTEIPNLIETINMFWSMLWEKGDLVTVERINSTV